MNLSETCCLLQAGNAVHNFVRLDRAVWHQCRGNVARRRGGCVISQRCKRAMELESNANIGPVHTINLNNRDSVLN